VQTYTDSGIHLYTVGHGNQSIDELIALLRRSGITCLVDVRAHPGSRRHPQFGRDALESELRTAGIQYVWEGKDLGGRRRAQRESRHRALRNESFRAYADHMQTADFRDAVERLLTLARSSAVAIMCAERLPWQCHRFMISDYLVAHGVSVLHVIDTSVPRPHALREEARVTAEGLVYDVAIQSELGLPQT
jgi:uncharacterized protein (DUF488 family)